MRLFLVLVLVGAVSAAPASGKSRLRWDEWGTDVTGSRTNVCDSTTRDGSPVKVCCPGYSGRIDEGCPTPVCDTPCQNGGSCAAPNYCVCPTAFTGTTCTDLKKDEYQWSPFVSTDDTINLGDDEPLYQLRKELSMCKGSVPQAIECQTTAGIDYRSIGQNVTCDRRRGLLCRNQDQRNGMPCHNYQVKILCPIQTPDETVHTCLGEEQEEYDVDEIIKSGDCVACKCKSNGRWDCYDHEDYCDTALSMTPTPDFDWLPNGVQKGQCVIGETIFNPGQTTTFDCKTCTCDDTLGWICTPSIDLTCVTPPADLCWINDHFIFFHGQTTKKGCNTCICKNREWDCTQTICPARTQTVAYTLQCVNPETNRHHEDGEIVARDCNVCVCTQRKWDCTKDRCMEGTSSVHETDLAFMKVCTLPTGTPYPHGTTLNQDCNVCKCFNGKWSCTNRFCSPETYPNSTCVDEVTASLVKSGQTIHRGCNICLCNSGNLTCTTKPCTLKAGICFDELRRYSTSATSFGRQYRPVCNNNGTFQTIQCNSLHGVCFCVTTYGQVVPGTAVRQGTASPNCSPYAFAGYDPLRHTMPTETATDQSYPCIEDTGTTTTTTTPALTGYNMPKCLGSGFFAPLQCDAHLGMCYCVMPRGTTIPGTLMHVSQGRPNCEVLRGETHLTETPCRVAQVTADKFNLPFSPECDGSGQYNPLQVNSESNIRFCVDRSGAMLEWTITNMTTLNCNSYKGFVYREFKPYTARRNTEVPPMVPYTFPVKERIHTTPRCLLQQEVSLKVPGVFWPVCEPDGRYQPRQCPRGTGVCFCVDATGATVPKTVRPVGTQTTDCSRYQSIQAIVTQWNTTTVKVHPAISLTHSGWEEWLMAVVHADKAWAGKQKNTTTATTTTTTTTTTTRTILKTNTTTCIRQQQIAAVVPGVFSPACLRNGSFNPLQHHPLSTKVFCVDKNGVKIQDTEVTVTNQPLPNCNQYWNTTIDMMKVIKQHWSNTPEDTMETESITIENLFPAGLHHHPNCTKQQAIAGRTPGVPAPTCEPNGTYTPLQCNATTGVCYCMLPYGDVLPETVLPIVKGVPNCWRLINASVLQEDTPVPEACKRPLVRGPCKGYMIRYGHSMLTNKCHPFIFGGCRGNGNLFESLEECEQMCGYLNPPKPTTPQSCQRKLVDYQRMGLNQRLATVQPQCTTDGNYQHRQCHLTRTANHQLTSICTCVHRATGEPAPCEPETETPELDLAVSPVAPRAQIRGCVSENVEYQPMEAFFDRCNDCTCIGNNVASCTNQYCLSNVCYHKGQAVVDYVDGCKHCTCVGGIPKCHDIPDCEVDDHGDSTSHTGSTTQCTRENGQVMAVHEHYFQGCKRCVCEPSGEVVCDTALCNSRHCIYNDKVYHQNNVVQQDCNNCTCFSGKWNCQNYTCHPTYRHLVVMEGCEYNGRRYASRETFYKKCNLCKCEGNNRTNCFNKLCNSDSCFENGVEITNGQSNTQNCRTCTCHRGLVECVTDTDCTQAIPEAEPEPEPQVTTTVTCVHESKTYQSGQEFWKDCNQCRCEADGQVQCDDTICSTNLCFKNGVPYHGGATLLSETEACTCFRGSGWNCVTKTTDAGPPTFFECPNSQPAIICSPDTCTTKTCPSKASENPVCVTNNCGQCVSKFYNPLGNLLEC